MPCWIAGMGVYSLWQCVPVMAPLESVHFSERVHVHVLIYVCSV